MRRIIRIEPQVTLPERKKVAAYARVSMESERLAHSLAAQISYYSELIQRNPNWEYAGVYADNFVSGTSTINRGEFQRMIRDCENGKIDIILTKSISRFARNTVDLLQAIRHLKELGVEVRFEKENLSSISSDGELILTLLAAFAEEESSSQSNNVKWSIQKKYEKGLTHAARRCLGYKWEDGHYVIIPEEAEIVKLVFQMYLDGSNCMQIAAHLKECGYKGIKGSYLTPCYVIEILDNITYQGDLRFQYTYSPKVRKQKRNYGEVPRYILSDAHEPIINREDFARAKVKRDRDRNIRGRRRETCFSRKIYCGNCGSMLYRATAKLSKTTKKYWNCSLKISSHGTKCKMTNIYESELETICEKVVGLNQFDELIEKVTVFPDYLIFQYYDGKETKWER